MRCFKDGQKGGEGADLQGEEETDEAALGA